MKSNASEKIKSLSQKIDMYSEEVLNKNYENFKSFAFGGMILTGGIALTSVIFMGHMYFTAEYCILFALFVLCNLYIHCFLKNHIKYTLYSFYIAVAPILIIGILIGTFLDPTGNAMTIMILLCTLFMFITDKPQNIITYILAASAVFLVCSFMCKTLDLFVSDVVNLVIYLSIGVSVNMLTLKDRVVSAENYVLAAQRADSDTLTSILNRGAGDSIVKKMLTDGQKGAFCIIDIDDFKHINDYYGHQAGDEAIRAVSQELKNVFRDNDIVWRLGGDEFAVFAVDLTDEETCKARLHMLKQNVSAIKISQQDTLEIKVSIGCSICAAQNVQFEAVYKSSDDALYEAKRNGKNGYVIKEM